MGITNKIKYLNITADTTIQQIADALGCEGFMTSFSDVSYGILTMEPVGSTVPNCGFAITGLGTTTWTLYAYVNGAPTTPNIKTMSGVMSYIVSDNYKIWGTGNGNLYDGYGFIKGKDMTMPNTPEMWECYTQYYSGGSSLQHVTLWDKYSTVTNSMQNLVALTNSNNLVILEPLYNYATGWLSEAEVYFMTNRPASYNTTGMVYNFNMNDREYLLLTCMGSISSAKSMICFDVTNVPDLS